MHMYLCNGVGILAGQHLNHSTIHNLKPLSSYLLHSLKGLRPFARSEAWQCILGRPLAFPFLSFVFISSYTNYHRSDAR